MDVMLKKNINKKEKIFVLEILRIYLSIIVVNTHCLNLSFSNNGLISSILVNRLHVPTFFIISFYFFQKQISKRNLDIFRQRFKRLLIPYIVWPIIQWIINNLLYHFLNNITIKYSFKDLLIQLLTGHVFNPVLWFQWNLIFTTFLFILIELISHKNILFFLLNIGLIAYFLQYSSISFNFFSKYNSKIKYTLGRCSEIMPSCISGFYLAYFKLIDFFTINRIKTIYICLLVFSLIYKYNILYGHLGFGYKGIKLNILSICQFIIFLMVPNKFIPKIIKFIITQISQFTPGIYYLHIPIYKYTRNIFILINKRTIYGVIYIYIICYFICFIGNIIFKKSFLRNLFK